MNDTMSGQRSRGLVGSPSSSSGPRGCGPLRATRTFGPGSPSGDPLVSPSAAAAAPTPSPSSLYDPGNGRSASSTLWTEKMTSSSCFGFAREKKLIRNPVETIRRSASFDTLASSYLGGEWPRSSRPAIHFNLVRCPIVLTADKWTQTVDDLEEQEIDDVPTRLQLNQRHSDSSICVSCGLSTGGFKEMRPRPCHSTRVLPLACSGCGSPVPASDPTGTNTTTTSTTTIRRISATVPGSRAITIPAVNRGNPLAPCQGSAEGFNQEIEKLVHSTGASDSYLDLSKPQAPTPDGHRAPIADLLNIRSVNTQTPSGGLYHHSGIEKHFLRILEDSDDSPSLPIIPGAGETSLLFNRPTSAESDKSDQCERVISGSISPASFIPLQTSEKRLVPEGCEKLETEIAKTSEVQVKRGICRELPSPIETNNIFKCLIPSERSAFCPLLKKYVSQQTLRSFSLSANESDSSIEAK